MGIASVILLVVGGIALLVALFSRLRANRIASAPVVKTQVAARGQAGEGLVAVEGNVLCQQLQMSPLSNTPCLYFEYRVREHWLENGQERTRDVSLDRRGANFSVDDGSGPVAVDTSRGGDIECEVLYADRGIPMGMGGMQPGYGGMQPGYGPGMQPGYGPGMQPGYPGMQQGMNPQMMGQSVQITFGSFRVGVNSFNPNVEYRIEERVLRPVQRLYVCGKAEYGRLTSTTWRPLIVSPRSRDEVLGSALRSFKIALVVGAIGLVVGGVLGIVSLVAGD